MHPNDTTQEIPYGYCHCGCGEKTKLATQNREPKGWVKGEPMRYIAQHHLRKNHPIEIPNPTGLCQCGCGQKTRLAGDTRPELGWAKGEFVPYVKGHNRRKHALISWEERFGLLHPRGECQCGCGQKTALATRNSSRDGWIKGKPIRFIYAHQCGLPEDRFWEGVNRGTPDECWEWHGNRTIAGYGVMRVDGKTVYAHRFSYQLHNGSIDDTLQVCHSCDNPPCVNPAHLWQGTNADNHQDMMNKGRNRNQFSP